MDEIERKHPEGHSSACPSPNTGAHTAFLWWAVAAIACVLWIPSLLATGMFVDGVVDAILALNLAHGDAQFWCQRSYACGGATYWDNPPLHTYLLSRCYLALGESVVVERVYSLATAVLQCGLIAWLWRHMHRHRPRIREMGWLPTLLFLACPLVGWCYLNNMMENTMAVFTTAAVLLQLIATAHGSVLLPSVASGLLILLALLTKGPVGAYPLAATFCLSIATGKPDLRRATLRTALQITALAAGMAVLLLHEPARLFVEKYLEVQLLPAMRTPDHEAVPSRLRLAWYMVEAAWPMLTAGALGGLIARPRIRVDPVARQGVGMLLIGACASAPIALSHKQHWYYLLPSLPVLALGVSCLCVPAVQRATIRVPWLIGSNARRTIVLASVLTVATCAVRSVLNAGTFARDAVTLADVAGMRELLGGRERQIRGEPRLYGAWGLRAYLYRLNGQELCTGAGLEDCRYFMIERGSRTRLVPPRSRKVFMGVTVELFEAPARPGRAPATVPLPPSPRTAATPEI